MFLKSSALLWNTNRTVLLPVYRTLSDAAATPPVVEKVSGFAEAYEKHSQSVVEEVKPKRAPLPFATLLKNSKFVDVRSSFLCITLLY